MYIISMKPSTIFPILFILGGVLTMPSGEEGAGDDTPARAHGKNCQFSTLRKGSQDPCGLRAYARFCSPKGPCALNSYQGYLPVIGNPYYFVQCGVGNVSHCQPCAPGTQWSQHLLTCVHANSRPSMPQGQKGAGDDTPTQAFPVDQTQAEVTPAVQNQSPAEVTPAVEGQSLAEVTPAVEGQSPAEVTPAVEGQSLTEVTPAVEGQSPAGLTPIVEDETPSVGLLPSDHGKKCRFSTFRRGKGDPCGLRAYARFCSPKGPCAFNGYHGYISVIGNPYYFVQCGAGNISHCQPCAPGTKWRQDSLTCVHANYKH